VQQTLLYKVSTEIELGMEGHAQTEPNYLFMPVQDASSQDKNSLSLEKHSLLNMQS